MTVKVLEVKLPDYVSGKKPNYLKIGKKVDAVLEKSLPDGKYLIRSIGLQDHPGFSLNKISKVILKLGTDKYDPERKSVVHDDFSDYDYDIQAGAVEIKNSKVLIPASYKYKSEFADIAWHFFEHAPLDRGYSVKIDLLLVYDASKFTQGKKLHSKARILRKELFDCLYKFKHPKKKKEALVALVKIN